MSEQTQCPSTESSPSALLSEAENRTPQRIRSKDLMQRKREIEIEHEGRIYRLRVTQLNKLILTA